MLAIIDIIATFLRVKTFPLTHTNVAALIM